MKNTSLCNPFVIHIPHSSLYIPEFLRDDILLNDEELTEDTVAFTDWRTRDLFTDVDFPCRVVYPVSRMVCDPERFRNDASESMAEHGFGAVYLRDAFMRPLRHPDAVKRELLLRLYYDPHHRRLHDAVAAAVKRFGHCTIVDAHSFSGSPLPYEPEQQDDRPDFCVGTCGAQTPPVLLRQVVHALEADGDRVAVDYPYAGSMVPLEFLGDPRVQTVMIEVNRSLYRHPDRLVANARYARVKHQLCKALHAMQ